MRRLLLSLVVGAGALAAGLALAGPAQAGDISERIAQHRAEVEAKIACHRAEIRGEPCGAAAETAAVAQPAPEPAPQPQARTSKNPLGTSGKVIEVSISEQKLRAWEGDRVVMETPVSTGKPGHETPRGTFEVLSKEKNHWSTQYHVDMPHAMRVVRGIFIHELPIAPNGRRLGASDLGTPVSAGCIRVGVGEAERLYNWASVGTPVHIH